MSAHLKTQASHSKLTSIAETPWGLRISNNHTLLTDKVGWSPRIGGCNDRFEIDRDILDKQWNTVCPDGYLRCVKS
jgi:hypothetical protein